MENLIFSSKYAIVLTYKNTGAHKIIKSFTDKQSAIDEFEKFKADPHSILSEDATNGEYEVHLKYLVDCDSHNANSCDCGHGVTKFCAFNP
jgi:hypothetical protein